MKALVLEEYNKLVYKDVVKPIANGDEVLIEIKAVGITPTIKSAIESLRKGATLVLAGNLSTTVEFPLQKVVNKEITMMGSCAINGECPAVLDLISKGEINVNSMISAVASLSEGALYFDKLYKKEQG